MLPATSAATTTTPPTTAPSAPASSRISAPAPPPSWSSVPTRANANEFDTRVRETESRVRAGVRNCPLNQNQFDALVSAAFNSGSGITPALRNADNNNDVGVAVSLRNMVHVHNRDQHGAIVGPAVVSHGLVNRRASEVTQYNTPVAPPAGRRG